MDGRRPSLSSGSGDWVSAPGAPFSTSHPCGEAGSLSPSTLIRACAFSLLGLQELSNELGSGTMTQTPKIPTPVPH